MELREGGSAVGPKEATLVERAKGGDVAAYEDLVRGHQAVAFRTAFTITGDAAEAEDAAQEAFVKVYRTLAGFAPARLSGRSSTGREHVKSRPCAGFG